MTRRTHRAATVIRPFSRDGDEDYTRVRWDEGGKDNTVPSHALEPLPANYDTLTTSIKLVVEEADDVHSKLEELARQRNEILGEMDVLAEKQRELFASKATLEGIRDGRCNRKSEEQPSGTG